MTPVLIPSNFQEDTLHCLRELTQTFPGLQLKVVLFHAFGLSSSITELLMLSRRSEEERLVSPDFWKNCRKLQQELPEIASVEQAYFYGTTQVAFKNFLHAHQIAFLIDPGNYRHQTIGRLSQDPKPFLDRCGLPLITVTPWVPQASHGVELEA
ncbi:hypothetical protein [Rufibacter tibetensis]|uniref:UspA domain-containing protein n=1 Tax=Rufibacter tibetensis TaxID=512763 RepID=A0A0N7HW51_9BACT|nr:hypothetical protein [Rufibacter tibetensis]ALI98272.1 hypothetical protein DC20_03850 [Rufibacter tibetensis]